MKENKINIVYHLPFSIDRTLKLIPLLEDIVAPERLKFQLTDTGVPLEINDMRALLEIESKMEHFPILNNGKEKFLISLTAYEITPDEINKGFHIFDFNFPNTPKIENIIYGCITRIIEQTPVYSIDISLAIENYSARDHTVYNGLYEKKNTVDLPTLTNQFPSNQSIWEIPFSLNWINFWSKAIIDKVGLLYESDRGLFYKSTELDNGGVLFQLTQEPLNINNAEHLETLRKCYERFDKIGNRYLLKDI